VLWPAWICGGFNAVNIVVCTGGGTVLHHSLSTCLLRPCQITQMPEGPLTTLWYQDTFVPARHVVRRACMGPARTAPHA
jgi:hypothetical protein